MLGWLDRPQLKVPRVLSSRIVDGDDEVHPCFLPSDDGPRLGVQKIITDHGVRPADIERNFQSSQPLRICNVVCNTHKHRTRRSGTTARVRDTELTPTGASATIEVDWASPQATTVDALDLAMDCVTSWRAFFTNYGIAEP